MRRAAALLLACLLACRSPGRPEAVDVFLEPEAGRILGPADDREREAIRRFAADLARDAGWEPDGSLRDLLYLRELYDRPHLAAALRAEPAAGFLAALRAMGYAFRPADSARILEQAAGPAGEALREPAVRDLLAALAAEDLLDEDSGDDALDLRPGRAGALRDLAARPDALARVRAHAGLFAWRFRPSDASGLLREEDPGLDAADAAFLAPLLRALGVEARPGWLPELRILAARPDRTRECVGLAAAANVPLGGGGAVLALAQLVREPPLEPEARERLARLAGRLVWPDAGDLARLAPLARDPRGASLVQELGDRFGYRLDASDAPDLLRLAAAGVPEVALPAWAERERVPLVRPGLLLCPEPLEAFLDPNDLVFLAALGKSRPDLVGRSRDSLEREVRKRLRDVPVRYRTGAPYVEDAADLSAFLRPDLLKAILVLDELDRPGTAARLLDWMARDLEDGTTEFGGWVRLRPDGRLAFELAPVRARDARNDRLFLAPDPLGAALEFHFHATDRDDAAFAGPSAGGPGTDLHRAFRHRTDGLVLTLLPGPLFDCDLYTSGKSVLDLGVRPHGR